MTSELRPIVAKDQVRLSAGRGLRLALSGMSYRLFRSGVTMAILALATAFLVHMLGYGLLQQGTEKHAFAEIARQRQVGQMMTRLTEVDPETAVVEGLGVEGTFRSVEYRRWSGRENELASAVVAARRLSTAAKALSDYPIAARVVLLGDAKPDEFLLGLLPERLGELQAQASQLGVRLPLGGDSAFRQFVVESLPLLRQFVASVREGHARAIQRLTESFREKGIADAIREQPPELMPRLRDAGFELSSADVADLSKLERRAADVAVLNRALLNGEIATDIGRLASSDASRVSFDTVSAFVTNAARAGEVYNILARKSTLGPLTVGRLLQLATERNRETKIAHALGDTSEGAEAGKFGLTERNLWLVALSFIVCIIGVANAMLMSVTERFTEIATMKCLGAMDGFVMMMFVFEAMIQGVVGGIVGLVIGVTLAVVRAAVEYGSLLLSATGVVSSVLAAMAVSLLVSVILAAVAAVGPSWLAARLSPMEAMRVE